MVRYVEESGTILGALSSSKLEISIFLLTILFILIFTGSLMYIVEGPANDFVNISGSRCWAIVTVSTVGYGEISPRIKLVKII